MARAGGDMFKNKIMGFCLGRYEIGVSTTRHGEEAKHRNIVHPNYHV